MKERTRTGWILVILFSSIAASLGLIVVYVNGANPQLEGPLLGISIGGIGISLILWAHGFLPSGDSVQEREVLEQPVAEEDAAVESAERGIGLLSRRAFLFRALLTAFGALGAALLLPIRSLAGQRGDELFKTPFATGVRLVDEDGLPIEPARVPVGGVITAFPESAPQAADAITLLIGMGSTYEPQPGREGWDVDGLVAYSKLCTHLGCPVGLYDAGTKHLICPCHQSAFDMEDGAVPTGGPATRPLPQLPLRLSEDGYLMAAGDFSEPTGPGFWRLPDVE